MSTRRAVVMGGLAVMADPIFRGGTPALARTKYPVTTEILEAARNDEAGAHRQYIAFAGQAKAEGYPGIAYLFAAQAKAERIHERNFEKLLARFKSDIAPPDQVQFDVASTRQNLMKAAADELECVNNKYPDILRELRSEGLQDAIMLMDYAWASEKQHVKQLREIQRWSPNHFEAVAKRIENRPVQYFVCEICGSTVIEIPQVGCSICKFPPEHYRKVEAPI